MKIAFIGTQEDRLRKLTKDFLDEWNTFVTPVSTIYDEELTIPDDIKIPLEKLDKFNEIERDLYLRMALLDYQYEKYKERKNVVWIGSSLDVLAEALLYNNLEAVSDEFVTEMIYKSKKIIKHLDLIYWMPSDKLFEEEEEEEHTIKEENTDSSKKDVMTEDERILETIYNNFWNDYIIDFDKSKIFPKSCPGIAYFETLSPISELRQIVTQAGNLTGETDDESQSIEKLMHAIKDKRVLKKAMEILKKPNIPLA